VFYDPALTSFSSRIDPVAAAPEVDSRLRRREARRRQIRRRRLTALGICVALVAAAVAGVVRLAEPAVAPPVGVAIPAAHVPAALPFAPLPDEIRGVHVTMSLASVPGKLDDYIALRHDGLNTIELDVKDESGNVGFVSGVPALARETGAARPYYDPRAVARKVHAAGLYLIGRVVSFEDPITAEKRPALAIHRSDGSLWHTNGGLAWLNPYSRAAWRYDVGIAAAAARAGFDEIQFDYVRFPSDGDLSIIRYPGAHPQPMDETVPAYLRYAVSRLHPLGVRVSADVFGLSATHELGIGQHPRELGQIVDALYPMVYPSHFGPGEYNLPDPNAAPATTVADALRDFRAKLASRRAVLVPWLQDFSLGRTYAPGDVGAQIRSARAALSSGFMLWNAEGVYTAQELAPGRIPLPGFRAPRL
jgi:hypothetical protein